MKEIENQIKVVLLCHFTNAEVRNILPLSSKIKQNDFAPWITRMIKGFEQADNVQIHIIAPHRRLKPFIFEFVNRGIYYHFFNPHILAIRRGQKYLKRVELWTNFFQNQLLVNRFIKRIKPDIINLIGAESPYYSSLVLNIKDIPVYVCIQGIYSDPEGFDKNEKPMQSIVKVERKIHEQFRYFGISAPQFVSLIKRDNENPVFLKQKYPLDFDVSVNSGIDKMYDFVYFGRVTFAKGVDKIIEAIANISAKGRRVTLNIVGGYSNEYFIYLNGLINKYKLTDQIYFTGELPTLQDVYNEVIKSRVSVISTKSDNLPQTIFESILLNIPVVATNVGGIPYLNKEGKTILLSEYGDINGLAENMMKLIDNPVYAQELTNKCKELLSREYNTQKIIELYIQQYKAIIDNYWNNTPIKHELLYNENDFRQK
ncbi:MAG: glycosyltransferase [Bacteroidales bacterium]|nr:glycosyltransferase [Bacteroidales bacterium]